MNIGVGLGQDIQEGPGLGALGIVKRLAVKPPPGHLSVKFDLQADGFFV